MSSTDNNFNELLMNPYVIAIVVLIISVVLYALIRRSKSVRRGVLLMGLSDSGKTLIYSQLLHSKFVNTQTSIKENTGEYIDDSKPLNIIDIPGHERLRTKFFDQYKSNARGIIYVIDSLTLQMSVRDVAEYLYVILSDPVIMSSAPQILILCNKQDEMLAKGSAVIKDVIEKEMNMLRVTKSSQLESVDSSKNSNVFLGKRDEDFDFSKLPPLNIEFAESCALSDTSEKGADLDDLKKWLAKIA